ncbi:MAG TPA: winged helix-turn-helix domain-containing protein, partial [Planctomycetota bacterium]|nr:winged helix-turn-helix domain-containing protein [Planctomycetota bacterium]
ELARKHLPAAVILDLMLPGVDGIEVASRLRRAPETADIAIIMLTAKSEESDVVLGLGVGADDYITKPFRVTELLARLKAVLRRTSGGEADEARYRLERHGLRVDTSRHEATLHGSELSLTLTEFRLLTTLASHPGRVFTREQLLEKVRGDLYLDERNIDVHVRALRKKLGEGAELIVTVRGVGYKFKD